VERVSAISDRSGCVAPRASARQTVFTFVNSRMPAADNSRPQPDAFTPPNGSRASDFTAPLTNTQPASISAARRSPRAASAVQMLAPSP
jgi:hypothetical protein